MKPSCTALAAALLSTTTLVAAAPAYLLTSTGVLYEFDTAAPGAPTGLNAITGLGAGESLVGLDFRPANRLLYALSKDAANAGRVYLVDPKTGVAALQSTLAADPADLSSPYTALSGGKFGVDFNPVADRLRVISDAAQNLRVNVANGLVTTDSALNGTLATVVGVAYATNIAGTVSTTLYDIDSGLDALLIQIPPNNGTLTSSKPLGVDTSTAVGFDILSSPGFDTAYAGLTVAGTAQFHRIDLETGAATLVGAFVANPGIVEVAVFPDDVFRDGFE